MTSTPSAAFASLRTRRSPKLSALTSPGPGEADLAAMLTIAARVPDHGKLTPWRFIIIEGARREALGTVIGACFDADHPEAEDVARAEARRRLTYAPVVIAVVSSPRVHPKVPEWEQVLSAGAACMNLLHAAAALGFGAVWLTEWYAFDRRITAELGLADHERIAGFIHIGSVREAREDRERPALESIVHRY